MTGGVEGPIKTGSTASGRYQLPDALPAAFRPPSHNSTGRSRYEAMLRKCLTIKTRQFSVGKNER